jgi:hypothetical protein
MEGLGVNPRRQYVVLTAHKNNMANFFALDQATQEVFPRHGWTNNNQGVRQLRLPVLRLYQPTLPQYEVYAGEGLGGTWLQVRSPYQSLRQLAVAVRDLHQVIDSLHEIAKGNWLEKAPSSDRDDALTRQREGVERAEILLIAGFVLLRRLADQLVDATRPLLFENWKSAPRALKTAIASARAGSLSALKPRCDLDRLVKTLLHEVQWCEDLRQDDGIRDILVHKEHLLQVGPPGSRSEGDADWTWSVTAHLVRIDAKGIRTVDVLPVLRRCLKGACQFMEGLFLATCTGSEYERGDLLFLTGRDTDVTGFWPAIAAECCSDA